MGLLGDFAKGFVIMVGVFWVILIIEFIAIGQIEMALLLLLTLLIPLSMISYDYWKNKRK
jgi:hypothetical protein